MSRYIRRGLFGEFSTIRFLLRPGQRQITTITRPRIPTSKVVARTGQPSELLTKVRYFASGTEKVGTFSLKAWKFLRVLFLLTGGVVWGIPACIYVGYLIGLVKVEVDHEEENENESQRHDERLCTIFDVSRDDELDSRAKEIREKSSALMKIWNKLKIEDGILRKFGEPVDLIGYRGKTWIEYTPHILNSEHLHSYPKIELQDFDKAPEIKVDERKKKSGILDWCVACVVAGPKLTGILELEFSKVNSEWVPISLRLEGLQKTGDIICDVSGPLPNGVTRFTRLSND